MKQMALYVFRLAMLIAPAYSIYIYLTGDDSANQSDLLLGNAGFIAWALGGYVLLIWASLNRAITWAQIVVLSLGGMALVYFFLSHDIYSVFLAMPFFEGDNKKLLPVIPYVMTMITLLVSFLFRRTYKKA